MTTTTRLLVALVLVALALLVLALLVSHRRLRRQTAVEVAVAHAEARALRDRLDGLEQHLAAERAKRAAATDAGTSGEVAITRLGMAEADPSDSVPGRTRTSVVLSPNITEPAVRLVALGHGVRLALSGENRARLRYLVRTETKRARRQRRRDTREAYRRVVAERRAEARGAQERGAA